MSASIFGGGALEQFENSISTWKVSNLEYADDEILDLALNDLAKLYFSHPGDAAKTQKRYLKEGGLKFCGDYSRPQEFWERLSQINKVFPYFPWIKTKDGDNE